MRLIFLLSAAAIAAAAVSPATAGEAAAPDVDRVARALSDPQVRAGAATILDAFAGAILDTRVGPLAHYAPRDTIRSDDTLRDVARREDPDFDRQSSESTRGAVALAARTTRDAADMRRELAVTARRLKQLFKATAGALEAGRDDN